MATLIVNLTEEILKDLFHYYTSNMYEIMPNTFHSIKRYVIFDYQILLSLTFIFCIVYI